MAFEIDAWPGELDEQSVLSDKLRHKPTPLSSTPIGPPNGNRRKAMTNKDTKEHEETSTLRFLRHLSVLGGSMLSTAPFKDFEDQTCSAASF